MSGPKGEDQHSFALTVKYPLSIQSNGIPRIFSNEVTNSLLALVSRLCFPHDLKFVVFSLFQPVDIVFTGPGTHEMTSYMPTVAIYVRSFDRETNRGKKSFLIR